MFFAHAPISYLSNSLIQRKEISKLSDQEKIIVCLFSLFFGILPDFDYFILDLSNFPSFLHHEVISHAPILYIMVWLILRLLAKPIYNKLNKRAKGFCHIELLNILINSLLIGTISHILADTVTSYTFLLYPFSTTEFHTLEFVLESNLFSGYFLSPLFSIEIIIIALFFMIIYRDLFKRKKIVTLSFRILFALTFIYFGFTLYTNLNTYNNCHLYAEDGTRNPDIDYDKIKDSIDMDVNNNCIDNITETDNTDLYESALEIINTHKWADNTKIKHIYGGFDSYRLISQIYYNLHSPIEPVLDNYYVKYIKATYNTNDLDYTELLYEYLNTNLVITELQSNSFTSGKIIFLKDSNDNILNIGITLKNDYIAIVLPIDTNLQTHTYKEIYEYYKKDLDKIYIQE